MVICSIAYCKEHQHKEFNNRKICLFALPQQLQVSKWKGNPAKLSAFKAETQNKQRLASINIMRKGYDNDALCFNFNKNTRLCIHHFHPSTMRIDEN